MKHIFHIRPLIKPNRRIYIIVMGFGFSLFFGNLLYSCWDIFEISWILTLMVIVFFYSALSSIFGYDAVELDIEKRRWKTYTRLPGLKLNTILTIPESIEYALLFDIDYADNSTPGIETNSYYIVYLVFDGEKRQDIIETTDKELANERLQELGQLLDIECRDNSY